jgi:2-keto-4-pentenoate hydratase/2-oxohepta-3-ene-1,7-dioic acid hydratase in catechol pathway
MQFLAFFRDGTPGLAVGRSGTWRGATAGEPAYPGSLDTLIARGDDALREAGRKLALAPEIDPDAIAYAPPIRNPEKILCIGLNYRDHAAETKFEQPAYPTVFTRVASSLIGHRHPLIRPRVSEQFDFEGELVAIIGKAGRNIAAGQALEHVAGWSIFNDVSVRDYQFKSPQWTMGKNFDATGAFGPTFVTADEVPPGARGLKLETRLNGAVVQSAITTDMVFDVATIVSTLSVAMTLRPGDVVVTGTPAGVGMARKPPLWMKPGDVVEVEIEGLGVLRNPVAAE